MYIKRKTVVDFLFGFVMEWKCTSCFIFKCFQKGKTTDFLKLPDETFILNQILFLSLLLNPGSMFVHRRSEEKQTTE